VKIKSKLNGEVSNVRADIAREMVKLGVAELLEPDTGSDGIVAPNGEPPYRLPKPGDTPNPSPHFFVGVHEGRYPLTRTLTDTFCRLGGYPFSAIVLNNLL